MGYLAILKLGN